MQRRRQEQAFENQHQDCSSTPWLLTHRDTLVPSHSEKTDLCLENSLVCAIFLLSCSDLFVFLIASGVLVITQGMLHRESYRKKLFLAIYLIRVLDFLKFKGKSFLPILIL